jgi:hypothetical protein
MNNNGIAYRGYASHDPEAAIKKFTETIGEDPTIILIRPGYPVTKDHPLLLETEFCGNNMMMVSSEIDVEGHKNSFTIRDQQRQKRKILDAKLVRKLQARERKLEEAYQDDTTYFRLEDKEREEINKETESFEGRPNVMTDEDYLRLMERPGYVYLLSSDNGYHKIGRSFDVEDRRVQLERDIPVIIGIEHYFATRYYIEAEAYMHNRFSRFRTGRYEWFKLAKKQIDDFKTFKDYSLDEKLEKVLLKRR